MHMPTCSYPCMYSLISPLIHNYTCTYNNLFVWFGLYGHKSNFIFWLVMTYNNALISTVKSVKFSFRYWWWFSLFFFIYCILGLLFCYFCSFSWLFQLYALIFLVAVYWNFFVLAVLQMFIMKNGRFLSEKQVSLHYILFIASCLPQF